MYYGDFGGFGRGIGLFNTSYFGYGSFILQLLIIVLVVSAIYFFIKRSRTVVSQDVPRTPIEVAKLRYARGEITYSEYQEIVKNLST